MATEDIDRLVEVLKSNGVDTQKLTKQMSVDKLTDEQKLKQLAGTLYDGLAYGNWPNVFDPVGRAKKIVEKLEHDEYGKKVADSTWRKGFLHLTVDGDGLVSLWDDAIDADSYLKLELTTEQQIAIDRTTKKRGATS